MQKKFRAVPMIVAMMASVWCSCERAEEPEEKVKIEAIIFERQTVSLEIGEEVSVKVSVKPDESKRHENIQYMASQDGIVDINMASNDGFVVKGTGAGSTVIIAKAENVTNYLEVRVIGSDAVSQPYIMVPVPVIEMNEGETRNVQVTLYGGSVLDNSGFIWSLEKDKEHIAIDTVMNSVIIRGLERGNQRIYIEHPRSEYAGEILVFVKGVNEQPCYITSSRNVELLEVGSQYTSITVSLFGGEGRDQFNFNFAVAEGEGIVDIISHNDVCNIRADKAGSAIIRVTHPKAEIPFDIRVIAVSGKMPVIVLDKTFVILEPHESVIVNAGIENAVSAFAMHEFNFSIESGKECIEIVQVNNELFIQAVQGGIARIVVNNSQADFSRDILIVVRNAEAVYRDSYYITTSQNVIQTQVGSSDIYLQMLLVGGNSGDANSFEWVVSDGTVINVVSGHGKVSYAKRAAISEVFNAVALITPVRSGTATILISHPKSEMTTSVLVKVYPKGTFADTPVIIKTEGLLKVLTGDELPVTMEMVSGELRNVGQLQWKVDNTAIAEVNTDVTGMTNVLSGKAKGQTRMTVTGNSLLHSHESIVLVGSREEIDNEKIIYVDSPYQSVAIDQVVRLEVKYSQGIMANVNGFTAMPADGNMLHVIMIRNQLVLQGRTPGETTVRIRHPDATNSITVTVRVIAAPLTIEKPYYLNGPYMVGVVKGQTELVNVDLVGAPPGEFAQIQWSFAENQQVVKLDSHGEFAIANVILPDGQTYGQTVVTVSHPKSENVKKIILYAVGSEAELKEKIAIGTEKQHYLLNIDEEILLTVITNADDSEKLHLQWNVKYGSDAVHVNPYYDSAMVRTIGFGYAEIEVTHPKVIKPLSIFVSVADIAPEEKQIRSPAIIELLVGESRIVSVQTVNMLPMEIKNILWSVEDSSVAGIQANGDSAYMMGMKKGVTYINIRQNQMGYQQRITVLCGNTPEELQKMYVMSIDKTYYRMNAGDELPVRLQFGSNGFPETEKAAIRWEHSENGAVRVTGSGERATIVALKEGIGIITVSSSASENNLRITVEVAGKVVVAASEEKQIQGPATIELLVNESRIISVNTVNVSPAEIAEIQWTIEDSSIAGIESNGGSAYIIGRKKGITFINVKQNTIGYNQRITLLCANTPEELQRMYIMGIAQTYHRMSIGDELALRLEFGSNGFPELEKAHIRWEATGSGVVRVIGNGDTATVVATGEGTETITVRSATSENDVAITIAVLKHSVQQTAYEFRGYERILGLLVGSSTEIPIRIYQGQTEITSGYSLLDMNNEKNQIITVNMAGNILSVKAIGAGQSYITVRHPMVAEAARILVYTALTQAELDAYYPIAAEKTNFLIQVGETIVVRLHTDEGKDAQNINDIQWGIENSAIIDAPVFSGKKTATVKARMVGECVMTVSFRGTIVERIYIAIVDNTQIDFSKRIFTEVIIGIVAGQSKTTTVMSNLTASEIEMLVWESENTSVVTVQGSGESAVITAAELPQSAANREAYITVSYGKWLKRHILVYVVKQETGIASYCAMNMEDQYIRIGRNDSVMLQMFFKAKMSTQETVWRDIYGNNVVGVEPVDRGSKIIISGINEGIAVLEATNSGRTNTAMPMRIYIEVSYRHINIPVVVPELKYLTTSKTVYVLNPDSPGEGIDIRVSGIGMTSDEITQIQWQKDNNKISIFPNGETCSVLANGEGETAIKVWSHYCSNQLEIKVIVTRNPELLEQAGVLHYICEDMMMVPIGEMAYNRVSIGGIDNYNYNDNNFTAAVSHNADCIQMQRVGGVISIKGVKEGVAVITVGHPVMNYTKMIYIVVGYMGQNLVYLTTMNNLNVMSRNEYRTVSVDLAGFAEPNDTRFEWKVASGHEDIISIAGSGRQAQVHAKAAGTARIDVNHPLAMFPLSLYVRVSNIEMNPVYITTEQNIVSIAEGNGTNVNVQLVNGQASESMLFTWQNLTPNVINVHGTGENAVVQGVASGVGRVRVSHVSCLNSIELLVLVERNITGTNIYITTDSTLIEMRPTDTARRINVRLVGGSAEDIYGFKWEIANQNSVERFSDGLSKPVIDITPGTDSAFITAKSEGEAIIRVSHPKTAYRLEIKIDVKMHSIITFRNKNVTMDMGTTNIVEVDSPTGTMVIYESSNRDVVSASGTSKVCLLEGYKKGFAIVTARNITGTLSDEMIVEVRHVENVRTAYIKTSHNLVTMNKNDSRITVTAETVGEKENKSPFGEADYTGIQWFVSDNDKKIITINPLSGRSVQITPVGAGTAEIQVSHPLMPSGYRQKIYVQVSENEYTFSLDKSFIMMQPGKHETIESSIVNVAGVNYAESVRWTSDDPAIVNITSYTDNGKKAIIASLKSGESIVRAVYRGLERTCTVIVEPEKSIEITGNVYIQPGEQLVVPYTVIPSGGTVVVETNEYNFVEVIVCPTNCDRSRLAHINCTRREITLRGREQEGITEVKLNANGIQQIMIVQTSYNYLFRWAGETSVRMEPKTSSYQVRYDVFPPGDTVTLTRESENANSAYATATVDSVNQVVTIRPIKTGALSNGGSLTTMPFRFQSQYNKGSPYQFLDLPVYIYYSTVPFNFDLRNNSGHTNSRGKRHSRISETQNAIYAADGENMYIYPKVNEQVYPLHGLTITKHEIIQPSDSNTLQSLNIGITVNNEQLIITTGGANISSPYTNDYLYDTQYIGLLKIYYAYFNGRDDKTEFSKTYMLYKERYARTYQ